MSSNTIKSSFSNLILAGNCFCTMSQKRHFDIYTEKKVSYNYHYCLTGDTWRLIFEERSVWQHCKKNLGQTLRARLCGVTCLFIVHSLVVNLVHFVNDNHCHVTSPCQMTSLIANDTLKRICLNGAIWWSSDANSTELNECRYTVFAVVKQTNFTITIFVANMTFKKTVQKLNIHISAMLPYWQFF